MSRNEKSSGGSAGVVLTALVHRIIQDLRITPAALNQLKYRYVTNPLNGVTQERSKINGEVNNLTKLLQAKSITWKNFIKCMRIFEVIEIEFIVRLKRKSSSAVITEHSINVGINVNDTDDDDAEGNVSDNTNQSPV